MPKNNLAILPIIAFATCGISIATITLITTRTVNSQPVSGVSYSKVISGVVRSYSENEVLVNPNQGAIPSAIASPIVNVPVFDQTVVRNPINLENAGSAHIKCIVRGDNRGSGQSLGNQINYYKITSGGISQPRLDDGDIVEIQVLQ